MTFGGNLGSFDGNGELRKVDGPSDRLGLSNPATGLWVIVHTGRDPLYSTMTFGATSKIAVSGLRVANTDLPDLDLIDGANLVRVLPLLPLPPANVLLIDRSLPQLTPGSGDPGVIGPGPRNVDSAGNFSRLAALPEVPIRPIPEPVQPVQVVEPVQPVQVVEPVQPVQVVEPVQPLQVVEPVQPVQVVEPVQPVQAVQPVQPVQQSGDTSEARRAAQGIDQQSRGATGAAEPAEANHLPTDDAARTADVGRGRATMGAARDVFGGGSPLVPFTGGIAAHADGEYFSQGAFEFVETASRRAQPGQ